MLIDTHCHIHNIVKKEFGVVLSKNEIMLAQQIIDEAYVHSVSPIINVGTSIIESKNAILLAQTYDALYAVVGIHPTDTRNVHLSDMKKIDSFFQSSHAEKIVGLGECGFDFYHAGYSKQKQEDFFVAHIELALQHDCALVVHSRDAYDETLKILERYALEKLRAVIHCFSYDQAFADLVTSWGFFLGIGGTITYPKNQALRDIVKKIDLEHLVLETDAPFLPIQSMRGKVNHPKHIKDIALFVSEITGKSYDEVAHETTKNAKALFMLPRK